jgi:hypothetical protein
VVLPMVLKVPLEKALPISLGGVFAWLLLTLPLALYSLRGIKSRLVWALGILLVPALLWVGRGQVPAAGLAVTEARITQSIDSLTPGPPVRELTRTELARGVIAFAQIRAPAGLAQSVVFQWKHDGERENIAEEIHGGSATGFRTYSRKRAFPRNAGGTWTVDVLTPQGQLLKRLQFEVVEDSAPPAEAPG